VSDTDPSAFLAAERQRRRRLGLIIAAVLLVPLGYLVVSDVRLMLARREAKLGPEQRSELTRLLDARESLGRERVERWNAAAQREALASLTFADAPCPLSVPAPTPVSAATYVKHGTRDSAFGSWPLCILRPEAKAGACAQTFVASAEDATLRARLEEGDVYTWDLETVKNAPPVVEPPRVLVLVETEQPSRLKESIVGRLSFVPGALAGRAFLFVPADGRFVCGAAVSAQNSQKVETEFDDLGGKPSRLRTDEEARAALDRDLEVRVRLALPPAWRKLEG
jgi:hypothetical protein